MKRPVLEWEPVIHVGAHEQAAGLLQVPGRFTRQRLGLHIPGVQHEHLRPARLPGTSAGAARCNRSGLGPRRQCQVRRAAEAPVLTQVQGIGLADLAAVVGDED
ncbi:unnamed protein product [Rangifer tarandus platyrhynchus]